MSLAAHLADLLASKAMERQRTIPLAAITSGTSNGRAHIEITTRDGDRVTFVEADAS